MTNPMLSDADIDKMQTPLWEQARAAFMGGRSDDGSALLDKAVDQWGALKDYSINWITVLLSFIADEFSVDIPEEMLLSEEFSTVGGIGRIVGRLK